MKKKLKERDLKSNVFGSRRVQDYIVKLLYFNDEYFFPMLMLKIQNEAVPFRQKNEN